MRGGSAFVVVAAAGGGVAGAAAWRGGTLPPGTRDVDVELEVPGEVDWRQIVVTGEGADAQEPAEDELLLRGVVEDLDQDGVLTLHVAGSVVLIETVGEPPLYVVGKEVAIIVRSAEIYPTGV
ncbi:hypothetical protein [Cellulomonas sp. URHB0016]